MSTRLWAFAFIAPNAILFGLFMVIPVIAAFGLSLFEWDLIGAPEWVGLDNYFRMAEDPRASNSIIRTLYLVVGGVIPTVAIGFIVAVGINTRFPGVKLMRTLFLMPIVISFVASAVLWTWIYDPRWGPVNWLLSLAGIDGPSWLTSTAWALPAITVVVIWLRLPLAILLYLAALQQINQEMIEASNIDGANAQQRLTRILWPSVRPVTLLVTIVTLRGVLFDAFDVVQVMTGGGPLRSTDILIHYIYDAAFRDLQLGYASALASVLFVIVLVLALMTMGRRYGEAP